MTSDRAPRRIHVERTANPAVLCWVVHDLRLETTPPGSRRIPEHSTLGRLAGDGSITDVTVRGSMVLVEAGDPQTWPELAHRVHAALIDELDLLDALDRGASHWLLETSDSPDRPPSTAELQQIVDRAAGSVMSSHGGAMTVIAVDGDTLHLRTVGACTGCRQSDDTILGLIRPAVQAAHASIVRITFDAGDDSQASSPISQRVPLSSRLRRAARSGTAATEGGD